MEDRKKDHINLAFQSRVAAHLSNNNFFYEPLLAPHPTGSPKPFMFAGKEMRLPLWISSMTGGTQMAATINRNLAMVAGEFGLGMGLGSCRALLENPACFNDFNVRPFLGNDQPFYANLGICQLEKMLVNKQAGQIEELVESLQADGIIIHINPLQEAFQPEGDRLTHAPIDLIEWFLSETNLKIIVKEVGQGMGPQSLTRLLSLPLEAIEFGAFGGTNFSLLELQRQSLLNDTLMNFTNVGHTAYNMTLMTNQIVKELHHTQCNQLIISGGISSILDGYFLTRISQVPAIVGMGAAFLQHATGSYEQLREYVLQLEKGWMLANQYLTINHPEEKQ
jgi:isopentenyl-diphosphate delta-isomerase